MTGLTGVTDIAASGYGACVVHGGRVSCWGDNSDGQLGQGTSGDENDSNVPVEVRRLRNVVNVAVGGGTVCAVLENGSAQCWGENHYGQTGHNDAETNPVTTPWSVVTDQNPALAALGPYVDFECGDYYCCGQHQTGAVSCSGSITGLIQGTAHSPQVVAGLSLGEGAPPAAEPPPAPDTAEPAAPPTPEPATAEPEDSPRRRCDCRNVRRNCRLVYDEFGRPSEVCDCTPSCCCPGSRRR